MRCSKFSYLPREYLSSDVNVLTNSPTICNISKRDIFQLNFSYIQLCLEHYNMLTFEASSKTGLLTDLSSHVFHSV